MRRLREMTIPARGALFVLAAIVFAGAPCWGAGGLDNLAGPLRDLAVRAQQDEPLPPMGPMAVDDQVLVVVQFRSPMAAAARSLAPYGTTVRFRHEERVEAFVPPDRLLEIAGLPDVVQVRPPNFPVPLQGYGPTLSEGMVLVGGLSFYTAGIQGAGVTVAIIDEGFAGFDGAEIPIDADDPMRVVSFRADGGMGATHHGTAVAEVVADMAPQAEIVLIAVDTEMSIESAIDYVINRGIDVVCMSLGLLGGPYDGSHPVSRKVNQARDRGVFWVNAAGNSARRHWQGTWLDRTRNNVHEFAVGDDSIDLFLRPGWYTAHLSWYETAGSRTDRDYDLALYDSDGRLVARSGYTQHGDQPPADTLLARIPREGTYSLRIERMGGPDYPDRFQLFSVGVDLEGRHQVPASSLNIPAEARGSYTVGATRGALIGLEPDPEPDPDDPPPPDIIPVDRLEEFSSQGPVVGHPERIKPDLVAPNAVSTSLEGEGYSPFMGTSAAAPHVAGAAALLLSEDRMRTPEEVVSIFRTHAVRIEEPLPNNRVGYGRLNLRVGVDSRGPSITIAYPQNGATITTRTPTIVAFITDEGSGVNPESIMVELNSEIVFDGSDVDNIFEFFDVRTGRFAFQVEDPLARTSHFAVIRVADNAGNQAEPALTNFRVVAPSVPAGVSMVSFPYHDLQITDPEIILGTPLADIALVRWLPRERGTDKYAFYPDPRASLVPPDAQQPNVEERTVAHPPAGLGYFLSIPRQSVLDIRGEPLQEASTHIRLFRGDYPPRGWNMIGNPYLDPVSWGSVEFEIADQRLDLSAAIRRGITSGILFEFVQGVGDQPGYYDFSPDPAAATLEPGVGYWLHVNEDVRAIIYGGDADGAQVADQPAREAVEDDGWMLTLKARAGDFVDPRTVIGVMSTASAGYDPQWDVPKPPALVDGLRVSMPRPNWGAHSGNYARDIRSLEDDAEWDIEVACSLPDTEVEVTWPRLNAEVPDGVRLVMQDLDTGRTVYMRTSTGYRFRTGSEGAVRRLRVSLQEAGHALTVQSMSAQSAGGGAMITYSVSQASEVSVEVMNIAGRTVRHFPTRAVDGGQQETLAWNGISDRGSSVPSGRYIVRLTALAADGQTVRAIRPFSITR